MPPSNAAAAPARAPKHSAEQWEAQKPNIKRLYITERKSLAEVIGILARDFGFTASEKQLKSRLPKWGLDVKNLRGDIMIRLARTKAKRKKFENKDTSFRVNEKTVQTGNIGRYLQRHNILEEELLAMASPVDSPSPAFSISTPETINSTSSRNDVNAHSRHSAAHDRRFQGLPIVEAELGAKMSNYRSPTVEDVLDENLDPFFSFYIAQAGQEDLLTTHEQIKQRPSYSETPTPTPHNLEARTPNPYTYSPFQSSKQTSPKANNLERRFILLPSQSAKQPTTTPPDLGVWTPRPCTISPSDSCSQRLPYLNNTDHQSTPIHHRSTTIRSPFLRNNNGEPGGSRNKKKAWQAKFALLHRELTS